MSFAFNTSEDIQNLE